jgi:hypothetical protein
LRRFCNPKKRTHRTLNVHRLLDRQLQFAGAVFIASALGAPAWEQVAAAV